MLPFLQVFHLEIARFGLQSRIARITDLFTISIIAFCVGVGVAIIHGVPEWQSITISSFVVASLLWALAVRCALQARTVWRTRMHAAYQPTVSSFKHAA